ncbi:hypothetical protein EA116_26580 [Salmonella enterica subsp. enterica serovar Santiago]|nr:hypothetical protein [Salmonella enterica subsp. enterica serovar Santiago]EBH8970014.1 hypothetical protein [Salmonella enterica subsp. enterica serovar Santiago]
MGNHMNNSNLLLVSLTFLVSLSFPLSAKPQEGNTMDCSWLNGSQGENGHNGVPNGNCKQGGNGGDGVPDVNHGAGGNGGNGAPGGGAGGNGGNGANG